MKLIIKACKDRSKKSGNEYSYGDVSIINDSGKSINFKDFKYLFDIGDYQIEFKPEDIDLSQQYLNIDVYQVPYQYVSCCKLFIKQSLK